MTVDPTVSPILDRLEAVGSPDDERAPDAVLADLEAALVELDAVRAPRVKDARISQTWADVLRAKDSVRTRGLEDLPLLHKALHSHRLALGIPTPKPPRKRFGLASALEDRPPPWSVCKKLEWEIGRPPMIVGTPGAGKTYAVQAAAIDMMLGRPLWGCCDFRVPRCLRVLHIDLDQGVDKSMRRYLKLLRGHGVDATDEGEARRQLATRYDRDPDEFGIYEVDGGEGLALMSLDPADIARWKAALIEAVRGYDVSFIDSLRRLAPTIDENDSRVSMVLDALRCVSEETQCVIILLHHASNKGRPEKGRPAPMIGTRGSSAIDGAAGTQFVIEEEDDHQARKVTQRRAGEATKIQPFYLSFEDDEPEPGKRRGLNIVYRTLEQVDSPIDGDKAERVRVYAQKVLAWVKGQNARGRGVAARRMIVASVEGKDALLYAAISQLETDGALVHVPGKGPDGKKTMSIWAVDLAPKTAPAAAASEA